jgi:two-component system LytT family response regulator
MTPIRVMVVDDEPLAREGLAELLRAIPGVQVVGVHPDGPSAIAAVDADPPDLLVLDIQMPGVSGFDVVAALDRAHLPAIVFATAHDAFAIKAFEVNALDYLLKPVQPERLLEAVERARRAKQEGAASLRERLEGLLSTVGARQGGVGRLIVREVGQIVVIATAHVDWIEGSDDYAKLHVGPKVHLMRETLAALEERLDPARFMRVHRSAIVNLARVAAVESRERGDATALLSTGARVKVMRDRRADLETRLQQLP